MRIDIVTLFPEMFSGFLDGSLLGAARKAGLVDIRLTNIRDFAEGVHRQVDDRPYGGGPGMLLMPGPVVACVESVRAEGGFGGRTVLVGSTSSSSRSLPAWGVSSWCAVATRGSTPASATPSRPMKFRSATTSSQGARWRRW